MGNKYYEYKAVYPPVYGRIPPSIRPYTRNGWLGIRPYTKGIRPFTASIRPYTQGIRPDCKTMAPCG